MSTIELLAKINDVSNASLTEVSILVNCPVQFADLPKTRWKVVELVTVHVSDGSDDQTKKIFMGFGFKAQQYSRKKNFVAEARCIEIRQNPKPILEDISDRSVTFTCIDPVQG